MVQSISTQLEHATEATGKLVDDAMEEVRDGMVALVASVTSEITPSKFAEFETKFSELVREMGREIVEQTVNGLEKHARKRRACYNGLLYRQRKRKTRNQFIATLFGTISVERYGYRYVDGKDVHEACIFPLELRLGLLKGVTPALGSRIAKQAAVLPQQQTIRWLREEHNVAIGAERLRKYITVLSPLMGEHRQPLQVQALLEAMAEANNSTGSRKPVLAVGRDGVTMCEHRHSLWEIATTATVTVFDRRGKRLLTVYLAHTPELGQATMSKMLTDLLVNVLEQWRGPLPTLAYITDSGSSETSFFDDVLRRMNHPRTNERLQWQRVVDFYHVATRVWEIAAALFDKRSPQKMHAWAHRMVKLLKKSPNGPKRLLHSAAAIKKRKTLGTKRKKALEKALNYIRRRTKWMRYTELRKRNIPIGSGITEAACKTVFTQRFKQSGMRWSGPGADRILSLRVILLSGIWDEAYKRVLSKLDSDLPATYVESPSKNLKTAA